MRQKTPYTFQANPLVYTILKLYALLRTTLKRPSFYLLIHYNTAAGREQGKLRDAVQFEGAVFGRTRCNSRPGPTDGVFSESIKRLARGLALAGRTLRVRSG